MKAPRRKGTFGKSAGGFFVFTAMIAGAFNGWLQTVCCNQPQVRNYLDDCRVV